MAEIPTDRGLQLRSAVQRAYSAAASRPEEKHAFPVGRVLAELLGYPAELLDSLPAVAVEAFAGVSNVSLFASLPPGTRVLDLGCGAGLDSLVATRRVEAAGRVIGIDFSDSMLARAGGAAAALRVSVTFCRGDAERLPLQTGSVDVALVNGIFNLNPARTEIFREIARVVRSGGAVYAAELILRETVTTSSTFTEAEWFG